MIHTMPQNRKTQTIFLDFEFRNLVGPQREILCVAWVERCPGFEETPCIKTQWLEKTVDRAAWALEMAEKSKNHIFVAYTEAEAYCLLQLWEEFDCLPERFLYYDLYLEYRMLTNHNYSLSYGKQYINGKEIFTVPPRSKWDARREKLKDSDKHHKPQHSLAACSYKLLDVKLDTEHKDEMRDLIISGKPLTTEDIAAIQEYCASDVIYLPQIYKKMGGLLYEMSGRRPPHELRTEMLLRGEYSIRTARMARLGYPIDEASLRRFSTSTTDILNTAKKDINEAFPDVAPFQWNMKSNKYIQKSDRLKNWIKEQRFHFWEETQGGSLAISKSAFEDHFKPDSKGFGGAFLRFLRTKQSLNGFLPHAKKTKAGNFWDYLGDDGRIHPSFGIYGAQSGRSQPKATGYLLLKSHWMRAFMQPTQKRAIVSIDYSSQEFLLSALLSRDKRMIAAYVSGDPYTYFGKLDGAIPQNGSKETHGDERLIYKAVVLGISYLMGAKGLSHKLTSDLGRTYTEAQALRLIESFQEAFPDFALWQKDLIESYYSKGRFAKIKLPCGWYMWSDNKNPKSVGNMPIQGLGSSIMRKAVGLAQDRGLDVIATLHDALYVEYDAFDFHVLDTLYMCMSEAFSFYFPYEIKKYAKIRMDIFTWSPSYSSIASKGLTPINKLSYDASNLYLDKRGEEEYFKYSKY